ncbi:MAG: hypothetical protein HY907_17395 [Deltaproteobacteria bacterium]|nr:hypothetical protein [Deltaproteobacteria bacterium]
MEPFLMHDAHALRIATGRSVLNLRELLTTLREAEPEVLRHHLFRFPLHPAYDFSAFGHELAAWAETGLQDAVLAEKLGHFDPYADPATDAVRAALLDIVEEHLIGLSHVPWARPGHELHLMRSILVAYPTGEAARTLRELAAAVRRSSRGSLYFHFFEARLRLCPQDDDFSRWLEVQQGRADAAAVLRRIDFPALRVDEIREQVAATLEEAGR